MLAKRRNALFALLGAAGLVLKGRYAGPFQELVRNHGGNVVASFAVYFIVLNLPFPPRYARLCAAGLALAVDAATSRKASPPEGRIRA